MKKKAKFSPMLRGGKLYEIRLNKQDIRFKKGTRIIDKAEIIEISEIKPKK